MITTKMFGTYQINLLLYIQGRKQKTVNSIWCQCRSGFSLVLWNSCRNFLVLLKKKFMVFMI